MRKALLALTMVMAMSGHAQAVDSHCTAADTLMDCFKKFNGTWLATSASHAQNMTTVANTGVSGLLTPTQSTTKDFLSRLSAAFAAPMSGDGARPVSLAWNVPIHMLGGDEQHLNLQGVFAKPEMSGDLRQRLESNAAAMTAVKGSLSELDDLTVSASFAPSTPRLGRSMTPHRARYDALLGAHLANEDTVRAALGDVMRGNGIADVTTTPLGANVAAIEDAVRTASAKEATRFANGFAVLLDNQPQFYGEVQYRARKNLVGPDERSVRLTYEMGFHNLNTLPEQCGTDCVTSVLNEAATAGNAPKDRVAFGIEYRKWSALDVALPEHAVHFLAPPARSLVYSLTYGRNHMMMENGRLDLEVNYEDTTARTATDLATPASLNITEEPEPVRDRFVASATYTYQMTGQLAMPLTLTYANHASFLGDTDRRLNAHFGLSFKMRP
jgi:hypothetical protein